MKGIAPPNPFGSSIDANEISLANGKLIKGNGSNVGAAVQGPTTKGDLVTFDTDMNRLGVGANNQVLVPDSAQALGIKWTDPRGISWEKLDEVSLGGANATLSTNTLPACKALYMRAISNGTFAPASMRLRANADSGNNYRWRRQLNNTETNSTSDSGLDAGASSTTGYAFLEAVISDNLAALPKVIFLNGAYVYTGATAPDASYLTGVWTNTAAQITALALVSSVNWPSGSIIQTWGAN